MPFISAEELTNHILKKIASGDESVFLDAEDGGFNFQHEGLSPLSLACNNGHINIVNRFL